MTSQEARLITIVDDDYPENLKLIVNRPPFIWVAGIWTPAAWGR